MAPYLLPSKKRREDPDLTTGPIDLGLLYNPVFPEYDTPLPNQLTWWGRGGRTPVSSARMLFRAAMATVEVLNHQQAPAGGGTQTYNPRSNSSARVSL